MKINSNHQNVQNNNNNPNVFKFNGRRPTHGRRGKVYAQDVYEAAINTEENNNFMTRKKQGGEKNESYEKPEPIHGKVNHNNHNENNTNENAEDENRLGAKESSSSSFSKPKEKTVHSMAFVSLFFATWAIILSSVLSW